MHTDRMDLCTVCIRNLFECHAYVNHWRSAGRVEKIYKDQNHSIQAPRMVCHKISPRLPPADVGLTQAFPLFVLEIAAMSQQT